jgi:hypothetical protein
VQTPRLSINHHLTIDKTLCVSCGSDKAKLTDGTPQALQPLISLINQRRLGDALEYLEKLGIEENYALLTIGMLQRFGGAS